MRFLITGAGGMLGQDLSAAAAAAGHQVLALARADLDVTDPAAVTAKFAAAAPQVVVNCAAYTDVDGAESSPDLAAAVNERGAANVAAAAVAAGALTVQISTDYVFDGSKRAPYLESDPTCPRSVYGASKLAGERAVAEAAPDAHTIVRTAWLYGAGGSCFPATILKLARERDRLQVVDDQVGCPTYTGHLATALVRIAAAAHPPRGLLHVVADGHCSWYELALAVLADGDGDARVEPCATAAFPRPAQRPAYSVLRSERGAPALPHWRQGLAEYLRTIGAVQAV